MGLSFASDLAEEQVNETEEAWVEEELDGDKGYEAALHAMEGLLIYSAGGDMRSALREVVRTRGGIAALISQMALVVPQNLGADAQLVTYPLVIGNKKYYFGFETRRKGVTRLEELEKYILEVKQNRRRDERIRAERESMGRRGRRRTAVVAAVVQPNHNQQLLKLLRPVVGPPSSCGGSSTSGSSAFHGRVSAADSSGTDDGGATEEEGSGSDDGGDKPATPARRDCRALSSGGSVDTLTALRTAAASSPPSKGQFRTLHRLKIRSLVAPNSTPVGYLPAGSVIRLLEQVQHTKADGHRTMGGAGVEVAGSESAKITAGWIYTAVGFGAIHKPTVHGPLTKAEATELKQALRRKQAAYALEVTRASNM